MAKFKKGDKVVRHTGRFSKQWMDRTANPLGVFVVSDATNGLVCLSGVASGWDDDYFDLYVEPQPEPVTVTEPAVQQIPGVPDGYRAVRWGHATNDDQYVGASGSVSIWQCHGCSGWHYLIVEPIVPPAPPTPIPTTVTVQLNRYLVGDLKNGKVCVCTCTAEYAEFNLSNYRLLGPSETLELEVEV